MQIERTENEIILKLPADTNVEDLQAMMDFFEYTQITKKSKATQQDVDDLVKEIKQQRTEIRSKSNL